MALLGILLMVASTAAAMVPPYLTMPILDKVLIPYQNGTAGQLRPDPLVSGRLAARLAVDLAVELGPDLRAGLGQRTGQPPTCATQT